MIGIFGVMAGWAVPPYINFQGRMSDANGPITVPTTVTFSIYNVLSGGTALWTEQKTITPNTKNGVFNTLLGDTQALNLAFDVPYWVGITIGSGAELPQRQALVTVPYAFRAAIAEKLVGGATQWTSNGNNLYYNAGNVGIGTINPGTSLEVTGSIKTNLTGTTYSYTGKMENAYAYGMYGWASEAPASGKRNVGVFGLGSNYGGVGVWGWGSAGTGVYGNGYSAGGSFESSTGYGVYTKAPKNYLSGNVGVGILTPSFKLHVAGEATGRPGDDGVAQLVVSGSSNPNQRLALMFDTNKSIGIIQGCGPSGNIYGLALQPYGWGVSIGTTETSSTKLRLVDYAAVDDQLEINNRSASNYAAAGVVFNSDQAGQLVLKRYSSTWYGGSSYQNNAMVYTTGSSQLLLGTNSTERIRIDSAGNVGISGNVGIGTTNPAAKLEVKDGAFRISNTTDAKNWELAYDKDNDYFYIDEYGVARRFVIRNGGNVGIGSSEPSSILDVRTEAGGKVGLRVTSLNAEPIITKNLNNNTYGLYSEGFTGVKGLGHGGTGVFGESDIAEGVYGKTSASNKPAITGINNYGGTPTYPGGIDYASGVVGVSKTKYGVQAITNSTNNYAGWFENTNYYTAPHSPGIAVLGFATATNGFITGGPDVAEWIKTTGPSLSAGDVLVIDVNAAQSLKKSDKPYSTLVAGIISTDPGFIAGYYLEDRRKIVNLSIADMEKAGYRMLALAGRVPCKVINENGPIEVGDLLTTSSTPGYAMKATDPKIGTILGKALEPLRSEKGKIIVLVTLQ